MKTLRVVRLPVGGRELEPAASLDEQDRRNVVRWLRRAAELGRPVVISPRLAMALAAIAESTETP